MWVCVCFFIQIMHLTSSCRCCVCDSWAEMLKSRNYANFWHFTFLTDFWNSKFFDYRFSSSALEFIACVCHMNMIYITWMHDKKVIFPLQRKSNFCYSSISFIRHHVLCVCVRDFLTLRSASVVFRWWLVYPPSSSYCEWNKEIRRYVCVCE
jgi:hypothetical protein